MLDGAGGESDGLSDILLVEERGVHVGIVYNRYFIDSATLSGVTITAVSRPTSPAAPTRNDSGISSIFGDTPH